MYIHFDEPKGEQVCRDIDSVLLARQELKLAIFQVLEEGDEGIAWGHGFCHPFGSVQEEARERFANAILARLK